MMQMARMWVDGLWVTLTKILKDRIVVSFRAENSEQEEVALMVSGALWYHKKVDGRGYKGIRNGEVDVFTTFASVEEVESFLNRLSFNAEIKNSDLLKNPA